MAREASGSFERMVAADRRQDWEAVRSLAQEILASDPHNQDAKAFLRVAELRRSTEHAAGASGSLPESIGSGRYRTLALLGEDALRRVYHCTDTRAAREVTLTVYGNAGLEPAERGRLREVVKLLAAGPTIPGVVTVLDSGEHENAPFVVCEYPGGGTLDAALREASGAGLPVERVRVIASEVCLCLEAALAAGLIHRNLKPSSIWLTRDGGTRVGDFGIWLPLRLERLAVGASSATEVHYLSPEHAAGGQLTVRSDLYSLGAVLYHMVAGRPPFEGDNALAIIGQHLGGAPVSPSRINRECPAELEALIIKMLSRAPAGRPASAGEVRAALASVRPTQAHPKQALPAIVSLGAGVFVGRRAEMERLCRALDQACAGEGRVAVLVGEPGAGKTRTAEELAAYAALRNVQTLWGRVPEETGAPPYWPWVQVLRGYLRLRSPEETRSELGSAAGDIARVVPELKASLPDIETPPSLGDPEADRFRLFDAVTTFLKSATALTPLLVVLDDLHWADESSLKLLEFAAHEIGGSRLLILGTYRDTELTRVHPLTRTLAELTRVHGFGRVQLRGLSGAEVGGLIERACGIRPPETLAGAIHTYTEGNPLFVTEVIRLLAEEGKLTLERMREHDLWDMRIPEGVREVIGRRLDRLSRESNRVLTAASVAGREFGADVVARLVEGTEEGLAERLAEGLAERQVHAALEEARAARLVEEMPNTLGRYRFTHKLVQETVLSELGTTQRVRLHARIVEILEALYGERAEEHAAELAGHCVEAHLVLGTAKLVRYSLAAGKEALQAGAWEDAYSIYRRAIDAKGEAVMDGELAELYRSIGYTLWFVWRMEESARIHTRLFEYAETKADLEGLVDALGGLGAASGLGRRSDRVQIVEYARRALQAVGRRKDPDPVRLWKMGVLAWLAENQYAEYEKMAGRVLTLARQAGHDALEIEVLASWAQTADATGRFGLALDHLSRLEKLVMHEHDLNWEDHLNNGRVMPQLYLGEPQAARDSIDKLQGVAGRFRSPRFGARVHQSRQAIACATGEWQTAARECAVALDMIARLSRPSADVDSLLCRAALVEHELGEAASGDAYLERVVQRFRDPDTPPSIDYMICETAVFSTVARINGTKAWLDLAQEAAENLLSRHFADHQAVRALGLIAVARGDAKEAGRLHDELLRVQEDCRGWFARSAGLMAFTAGEVDAALEHFDESYTFTRDAGYRPEHAWCCCDQADALLARGVEDDAKRAQLLLVEGRGIARELGMKPLEARIAGRLEKLSSTLPPLYPDGLTAREVEVLGLITRGLTNQEIGYELGISVKTVAAHISHIFEKTGVANRAQAAAYALKRGLANPDEPRKG